MKQWATLKGEAFTAPRNERKWAQAELGFNKQRYTWKSHNAEERRSLSYSCATRKGQMSQKQRISCHSCEAGENVKLEPDLIKEE